MPPPRRLDWVARAVEGIPGLIADGRELRRAGPSYTVDTLRELRAEHPAACLCLIVGADAAQSLHTWRNAAELPQLAHIVVFNRNGAAQELETLHARHWPGARQAPAADALRRERHGLWFRAQAPLLEISSSYVRQLLREGRSVRGLVPDAVLKSFTASDIEALTRNETAAAD